MVTASGRPTILEFGRFRVVPYRRQLLADDRPVRLGGRTFDLLMTLIEASGGVVGKDQLLSRVWPDRIVEENRLQGEISALRKAFGADRGLIQTVSGRGYQFTGEIRELGAGVSAQQAPAPFAVPAPPGPETSPSEGEAELIDREAALAGVTDHVATHRLATPVGDGGIGEERPGFQVARQPPPEFADEVTKHNEAEHRQITAMSCEAIGAATQADRIGLEDLLEAIGAFQHCVSEIVGHYSGSITSRFGNTVLVLFGYPAAHEHDAEQAVHAGLELCAAVKALRPDAEVPMRCRVGIATGMVIIGDLVGVGGVRDHGIIGDVPDLAVRLQVSAQPDAVTVDRVTRCLIGNLFDCRDLGALETNIDTEPTPRWQVLGESAVASRFEALRGSKLTRLVGRDEEINLLLRRWARVKAGDGQVILVSGEAGIGKSRITAAFEERLYSEPHLRLRHFCSPYHQDSALFPIIDQLSRAAGFARDDSPAAKLAKFEVLLARAAPSDEDVALLADLMSLPAPERHRLANLSPQRKKEKTLEALVRQLEGLAHKELTVAVWEDAHWLDPTSRELLDLTIERVRSLPVLLIVTFRPEFQPPWAGQPQVSMLALNRLDRGERTALVAQIAGSKTLPDEVVSQIAERTDGVPLFVEELTKSILESGLLREENDRYVFDRPLQPLAIPTTLHASLLARLDRLGSVRHVAQIGAAIGRQFSYPMLYGVSRLPEDELRAALARLVASELVFERGTPPDAIYSFKHALVQDAAHGSLLSNVRRQLHAQIAEALETHSPDITEGPPELLAQHYAEAGLVEKSVVYWGKAGHRSVTRSAMAEAAAQFQKGLHQLGLLPDIRERRQKELEFSSALGAVLNVVKGSAAPETGQAYARARGLWEQLGSPVEYIQVPCGQSRYHAHRGELGRAQSLADDLLHLSRRRNDSAGLVMGHYSSGRNLMWIGSFASSRSHLEAVLALYDPASHHSLVHQTGIHPQLAAQAACGVVLFCLGFPDRALAQTSRAIAAAQRLPHPPTLAMSLGMDALLLSIIGDDIGLEQRAASLLAVATDQGFPFYRATAAIFRGWVQAKNAAVTEGLSLLRAGSSAYCATGATVWMPLYIALLAGAYKIAGQIEECAARLDQAMQIVDRTGERWFAAELNRHKGLLQLRQGQPATAEELYRKALGIAREQEAKLWELRAAASLARLWCDQGQGAAARDLLAPVYDWFTEGFATPDLKNAKALLDELQ
jgi:DNA-binding winged helix-turn-helix (wHTH) protein/class 3 adenylate cyclase/predicted ATPase